MKRPKIKKNLKNLLVLFSDDIQKYLDAYGETTLGDRQDPEAYQEYRSLDTEGKWDFIKEREGISEEDLANNFWNWKHDVDEDNMDGENPDTNNNGELDYDEGFEAAQKSDDPTAPAGKSDRYYDGWNDGLFDKNKNNTNVGDIAKAITQNDLGRSL